MARLTAQELDEIVEAYCDANMKCDDDTGLYDVQPGCEARKAASKLWLTVAGVGMLINEVRACWAAMGETKGAGSETRPDA